MNMNAPSCAALGPEPFRVTRVTRESADVSTLSLAPLARDFVFEAGQFNMLYAWGVGEAAISISGAPAKTDRVVHTVRAVGGVTRALVRAKRGDTLLLRGPFGKWWPLDDAHGRDVILVAGGIGLAPLRAAIYAILSERAKFGRVTLLCGARSPEDLIFRKEHERWRRRMSVEITVDRGDDGWRGHTGVVTKLISRAEFESDRAVAFICGPEIMMRFAVRELLRRGVAEERIFVSLERNMTCGHGICGHCQLGPFLTCRDGPVHRYDRVAPFIYVREL